MALSFSDQIQNLHIDVREVETEVPVTSTGPRGGDLERTDRPRKLQSLTADLIDGLPTLHRWNKPEVAAPGIAEEQPWHRMAAMMMVAGVPNKDIAAAAKVHVSTVSNLKSQRWFQELLAFLANEQGKDLMGVMKAEALQSFMTLVDLRDSSDDDRIRLAAADKILDRGLGKPVQSIMSDVTTRSVDPKTESEELKNEILAMLKPSKS